STRFSGRTNGRSTVVQRSPVQGRRPGSFWCEVGATSCPARGGRRFHLRPASTRFAPTAAPRRKQIPCRRAEQPLSGIHPPLRPTEWLPPGDPSSTRGRRTTRRWRASSLHLASPPISKSRYRCRHVIG